MKLNEVMAKVDEVGIEVSANEVVDKVLKIKGIIDATPVDKWDNDALMDYLFTLSKLMSNLGDLKDYAYTEQEVLADEYKYAVDRSYLEIKDGEKKVTDKTAMILAEQAHEDTKEQLHLAKHRAKTLRTLYESCEKLISVGQSRAKSLADDRIRTFIPNN